MEKLIVRNDKRCTVLDANNKVISSIIPDQYLIQDINFNDLPSNVIDNVSLYLNKKETPQRKYECFPIDLVDIKKILFNDIFLKEDQYWKNSKFMYAYSKEESTLSISNFIVLSILNLKYLSSSNLINAYSCVKLLCSKLIENKFQWPINNTNAIE